MAPDERRFTAVNGATITAATSTAAAAASLLKMAKTTRKMTGIRSQRLLQGRTLNLKLMFQSTVLELERNLQRRGNLIWVIPLRVVCTV